MTTEIGILNHSAIALATDSAVTISGGQREKVFNTANKLFALSKYAPVAVMVYNDASFLDVPWETIFKMFRTELGDRTFASLSDYRDHLFAFLSSFKFQPKSKSSVICNKAKELADFCSSELRRELDGTQNTASEIQGKTNTIIQNGIRELKKGIAEYNSAPAVDKLFVQKRSSEIDFIQKSFAKDILMAVENMLVLSSAEVKNNFVELVSLCVTCRAASGIVIAGFGEEEYYPCLCHSEVFYAGSDNILACNEEPITNEAAIIPFAQKSDIQTFVDGISPDVIKWLNCAMANMESNMHREIMEKIKSKFPSASDETSALSQEISNLCNGAFKSFLNKLSAYQETEYVAPILDMTRLLNKEELANMAETLVNMVSFRKQITNGDETVGGPIDVAVITKGDGLIWMKRKHYFDPKLNHHFFDNYYANMHKPD